MVRVWYAGDEWLWHHLSMVRPTAPSSWPEVGHALRKGLYERAFGPGLDRVWVVSRPDALAMRLVSGVRNVDVIPNGVDAEHYAPPAGIEDDGAALIFWGRLDFGPNIQALEWFTTHVWPALRAEEPSVELRVFGFKPGPEVRSMSTLPGVSVIADRADIREDVARAGVVVLPFVSGGGIKNKLLEAAAMGKPIIASSRALNGLTGTPPISAANNVAEWIAEVRRLVRDQGARRAQGNAARRWVMSAHTWEAAARTAMAGLEDSVRLGRR